MIRIALVGDIGSGKTFFSKLFKYPVFNADLMVSNLYQKDKSFNGFTLDSNLVSRADKNAIILHCLPAYRSKEITDEAFESKNNRIFEQAENRLHAQQALLSCILS